MIDPPDRAPSPREDASAPGTAEASRRSSEERYRELFEGYDEGFCVLEMIFAPDGRPVDYRFLEVNAAFGRETGLHDAKGRTARELVPDLDASWFEIYGRVATTGEPIRFENHAPAMGRWFDVYARRLGGEGSREVALLFRDVSERVAGAERLRASENRFREMADTAPAMLWVTGPDHACTFLSRGWRDYTGQGDEEGLGFGWTEAIHPDDRAETIRAFLEAAERREPFRLEHRVRTRDGSYRWALDAGRPRVGDRGAFLGYIGSVIDIHERRLAEQELRLADERKSAFLGVLSHELRNPLAPIRNSVHLLEHAAPGSPAAQRAREVLRRQTDHLARLVGDLLDVTRISHGKIGLDRARLDLREVVRRTCEDNHSLLDEARLALDVSVPPAPVWLHADATRLAQALGNLLQNAAKFTPGGGRVAVAVSAGLGRAEVAVRDTGIGIPPGELARVFEPFAQLEQPMARTQGGLGLGLSLVKGLVELHGGTVRAESDGAGSGATFVLTLPLAGSARGAASGGAAAGARRGVGRHVLVVEDNPDAGRSLADLLELAGHRVELAADGAAGVALALARRPDVVLCDLGLPGLDGYAVARRLRAEPDLAATRLVALSGYAQADDRRRAFEAGFDAHLAKPVDLEALERLLALGPPGEPAAHPPG